MQQRDPKTQKSLQRNRTPCSFLYTFASLTSSEYGGSRRIRPVARYPREPEPAPHHRPPAAEALLCHRDIRDADDLAQGGYRPPPAHGAGGDPLLPDGRPPAQVLLSRKRHPRRRYPAQPPERHDRA